MGSWSDKEKDVVFVLFGGVRGKGLWEMLFLRGSYIGNRVKQIPMNSPSFYSRLTDWTLCILNLASQKFTPLFTLLPQSQPYLQNTVRQMDDWVRD